MEKRKKAALLTLFLFGLCFFCLQTNPSFGAASSLEISGQQKRAWAFAYTEKFPELRWLADSKVRKTEEGQAMSEGSFSELLYGQKYVEFDRSLMTIYCLKLFLDGSDDAYLAFTAAQPSDVKLSKESFKEQHELGRRLLSSKWGGLTEAEILQAMETALVLGDMGKSAQARETFKPFGAGAPDHDDFLGEALAILAARPELCPSFSKLPQAAKKLLTKTANLAHYGHITHLEGGYEIYEKLQLSEIASQDPIALSFDLFVHSCDVAGALGHVNSSSSLMYTESTYRALRAMKDSVLLLSDKDKTAKEAYESYLKTRASWLGLSLDDSESRVLARIGAMLRLFTSNEGLVIKQALESLSPQERRQIIEEFDIRNDGWTCRTPTYMPAVLVNLLNNPQLGEKKEKRLFQSITLGLPFICRSLKLHKEQLQQQRANLAIPLNFNKAAALAKTAPDMLKNVCSIDSEGNVIIESAENCSVSREVVQLNDHK